MEDNDIVNTNKHRLMPESSATLNHLLSHSNAWHLSIENMQETHGNVFYFPSYEIFMDDLRDYRFYDKDLCHPSPQGVEYVREVLESALFNESTRQKITEIEKELKRKAHRPIY